MSAEPAGEPVDAVLPAEDVWSAPLEWRRALHPVRDLDPVAVPDVDPSAYAPLLAEHAEAVRARITHPSNEDDLRRAGLAQLGGRSRLLRRASEPAPTPLGMAVVGAALLCQVGWRGDDGVARGLVDAWWAESPVDVVVRAVAELSTLSCVDDWTGTGGVSRASAAAHWREPQRIAVTRLRRLLAAADDLTWRQALAVLEDVRSGGDGVLLAAYLAPTRRDWLAAALAAGPGNDSYLWPLLLTSVRTPGDARTVWQRGTWSLHGDASLFTTLATHLGADAAPVLLSALDAVDGDLRRRYAGLIAALPGDEAFAGLLSRVDRQGVTDAVLKAKERSPHRAARLLAEAAAGSSATARTCAALLRAHLSAHPGTASVAEGLRPAARAALQAAVPVVDSRPVAGVDALPPVLVQAPWERRRAAAKPVVVAGLVAAGATTVAWAPGERDRFRRATAPWMSEITDWDAEIRKHPWNSLAVVAVAPREVGRRHLTSLADTAWCEPADASGVLAVHEQEAVPLLLELARRLPRTAPALLPVASPDVAVAMAHWLVRAKSLRPLATTWLRRHPQAAAEALVPPALGKAGPSRRCAERALRVVAAHDRELVERVAASYGPAAAGGITAMLAVDPLELLPARVPSLPAWLDLHSLPAVVVADRSARLDVDAVRRLLTCLALSLPGEPYAGVEQALPALDAASVAALAWAVLEAWRAADEPAKDGWVLAAQGLVGDDGTARRLSPLISAWPKQGGSTKAATGLEVLAGIGSDVALMHLHRLSARAASRPLRTRATALVQQVADDLGLSTEQLADRLVPDFGLDPDGRAVLDYGTRTFVVGFDEALKPYVEQDGARRAALPKPGAQDDDELAPAAYARFSALKKDVRAVATDQLRRFEQAMAVQRRWTAAEQRRLFVEHPLLWHLSRRLVWSSFDADGRPLTAFRVAEDRTLADRDDAELVVPDDALVGIAHPLHLGADLGTWTELFADYEVLQPFPQLGREVLRLTDDERRAVALTRFAGRPVETKRVYGLAARGWERAEVEDGGVQGRLEKPLPGDRVGVVDLDPGIAVGMPDEWPEQRFTRVRVVASGDDRWSAPGLPLGELDDITASELLRDLSRVAG